MGKIDLFEIAFLKPSPIYMGGEKLIGRVNIKLKDPLKINSIYVNLVGTGRVRWTEKDSYVSGNKQITNIHYENFETYLNKKIILVSKEEDRDLIIQGDLTYPFEITLPNDLPTSFQNKIGRIRYLAKGTIDIPWAIDRSAEKSFSVIHHYDLNSNPESKQAAGATGQKILCCGPCQSEPIGATFNLNKSGFVSGETLRFIGTIDNKSSKDVKYLCVKLIQQAIFHGVAKNAGLDSGRHKKKRVENREVISVTYDKKIGPKSFQTWDGSLKIPPVCATAMSSAGNVCKIIEIAYLVRMYFDFSKTFDISSDLTIPVIIGTIPLKTHATKEAKNGGDDEDEDEDADGDGSMSDSEDEIPIPTLPSLTYEPDEYQRAATARAKSKADALKNGADAGEASEEDANYKPLYPYYSFA